jgi:hypothetical protein
MLVSTVCGSIELAHACTVSDILKLLVYTVSQETERNKAVLLTVGREF